MKTFKKISLGLSFLLALVVVGTFSPRHTLAAATNSQDMECFNSMSFVNIAQISCTISGIGKVIFTDVRPDDNTPNYAAPSGIFCNSNPYISVVTSGGRGLNLSDVGQKFNAELIVGETASGHVGCQNFTPTPFATNVANTGNISILLTGGTDSAGSLAGVSKGGLANVAYSRDSTLATEDPTNGWHLLESGLDLNSCNGSILAVDSSGGSAMEFSISGGGQPFTASQFNHLLDNLSTTSGCGIGSADFGLDQSTTPRGFKIVPVIKITILNQTGNTCDPNQTATPGYNCVCNSSGVNAGTTSCTLVPNTTSNIGACDSSTQNCETSEKTCEANAGGWSLSWLACPLLVAADSLANVVTNTFEQQLQFRVTDLSQNGGQNSVKKAWDLIKNIASVILVIVMLVMIISQAFGGGPFDAYTVRKLLPRLVAAVILMQISWYLVGWVVDAVDDLGNGLADIMYSPFGGPSNLSDFFKLLANAHVGTAGAAITSWVGLIGVIIAGVVALPAVLVFCVTALAAALTGLFVLIFRKIFILLALIFAPIAILAWILPGTSRFYKAWSDNLIKILMMFPLVVALIAAGRIFAYVVGTTGNGTLINFILVLVGFFGPLFILPKTYQWGGSLMRATANGVSNAVDKIGGKDSGLAKGVRGYGERWQGQKAKAYNPSEKSILTRGLRRIQSGHILPTERSRRLTIVSGNKWAGERNEEAEAIVGRTYEKALSNGYVRLSRDANGNYLDANGRITDKAHAHSETLKGVEAGKQALVDLTGLDGSDVNNRAAQAAHKLLLDTHSEIELQKARIQGGQHDGKRITEVDSYRDTLENSPQHYSAITQRRPDQAPDVIESAFQRANDTYDDAYADPDEARRAARVRAIDMARLDIALDRLTPETLQTSHYGFFQDIARMGDAALSGKFASRISQFQSRGGVVGANAVGGLRGGKEQYVNQALAAAGASLDALPPPPPPTAAPPTAPPPGPENLIG